MRLSESRHLGSNPSPAAELNTTNSEFGDEEVRSTSPAKGGAGLALAAASPPLWPKLKRILMLSGE